VNEYDDDDEFRHSPSISASPRIVSLYTELYDVRCGLAVAAVLRPAIWPSAVREEAVIWLAIGPLGGFC